MRQKHTLVKMFLVKINTTIAIYNNKLPQNGDNNKKSDKLKR